jgi:4-hydroxy-tetrahydrodipicolinate synthase
MRESLLIDGEFDFLSGEDGTAVSYNAQGVTGCISVTANIAPSLCAEMQTACFNGDFSRALEIQVRLMPMHQALFNEPSPAVVKYACSLLGLCDPFCRLPMVELRVETKLVIERAMEGLG